MSSLTLSFPNSITLTFSCSNVNAYDLVLYSVLISKFIVNFNGLSVILLMSYHIFVVVVVVVVVVVTVV